MKLFVNDILWEDYYVYEPFNNEFDMGLDNLDSSDFIDLKKYHLLFCEFIDGNSQEMIEQGFTKESAKKLQDELKWAKIYPFYEIFEEPADFYLLDKDYGWQWQKEVDCLRIFKKTNNMLIRFEIEGVSEEDGTSPDFEELQLIIETNSIILKGEQITLQDFSDNTTIVGFKSELGTRFYFSKETAQQEKIGAEGALEELIPLIEHKNYKINSLKDMIIMIENILNL
jgi:hypothetical protein